MRRILHQNCVNWILIEEFGRCYRSANPCRVNFPADYNISSNTLHSDLFLYLQLSFPFCTSTVSNDSSAANLSQLAILSTILWQSMQNALALQAIALQNAYIKLIIYRSGSLDVHIPFHTPFHKHETWNVSRAKGYVMKFLPGPQVHN